MYRTIFLAILFATIIGACTQQGDSPPRNCTPTPYDEIGPFYRPNSPVRNKVGSGYVLKGHVLSENTCEPLPGSKIEFWLVNSKGQYDDDHRATVYAGRKGRYKFESNRPVVYVGRLPHIHMKITARGHEELITQHYPEKGESKAVFDIILEKAK